MKKPAPEKNRNRLVSLVLDDASIGRSTPDVEQERSIAIFDILEENSFRPSAHDGGPYTLKLSNIDGRFMMEIAAEDGAPVMTHILSMTPFRSIIKDYFMICESYYAAIRSATPGKIEAIDMARRGIHNEGSERLQERLAGKVDVDFDTARRLFTLLCALQQKR
ncbi:MAG: UPF0262 family protein [Rhizobiales bacterium]|nr:UPF0262 family protein [Hyphomicrobiales bacterium]